MFLIEHTVIFYAWEEFLLRFSTFVFIMCLHALIEKKLPKSDFNIAFSLAGDYERKYCNAFEIVCVTADLNSLKHGIKKWVGDFKIIRVENSALHGWLIILTGLEPGQMQDGDYSPELNPCLPTTALFCCLSHHWTDKQTQSVQRQKVFSIRDT